MTDLQDENRRHNPHDPLAPGTRCHRLDHHQNPAKTRVKHNIINLNPTNYEVHSFYRL